MKIAVQLILVLVAVLMDGLGVHRLYKDHIEHWTDWIFAAYFCIIEAIGSMVLALGIPELIWG